MSGPTTPTIHNAAAYGDIAKAVLMPGDPMRAAYIAQTYLDSPRLVSNVRGVCCYTGTYHGRALSVMASGMGAGSMSIYSYELFHFYDVDLILRLGTAGGLPPSLKLRDIVVAMTASTDCGYAAHLELPGTFAPCADYALLAAIAARAKEQGLSVKVGPVVSGEGFYYTDKWFQKWARMGILAVDMETAALYINAAEAGKRAAAMYTISDLMFSGEACGVEERQSSLDQMIRLGLSAVEDVLSCM
ncbi:MAG: purine-nucleoside phosphorylase [Oscillibacter sp.]|jgi:purine-nucleoside phosphorylase|uniref:purine-nucleoside phosphorylase n=1 Tax=uncultured Oscillibacter sp. TaxID=876091 RepID=UPI0021720800|nr:purine-nucleoside phosphorylase [uncultured Oscillibacter sp.]MCI9555236.1 purine-nucleoside phosphorylase [Oscillibacter sp.]